MSRKPEIGEILYITDKQEDLLGIHFSLRSEKVKVTQVDNFDHEYKLWDIITKTIDIPKNYRKELTFCGLAGKTFLWKDLEPKEKTTCPFCGSEEDFCICKLLMQ